VPKYPGFVGPTYQSRSLDANAERTINLYPELIESDGGVAQVALYTTPGLRLFGEVSDKPHRAMFAQAGRAFVVAGASFFEVFSDGTWTRYGSVDTRKIVAGAFDDEPATISSNGVGGNQLFITAGGTGYTFDLETNTLVAITDEEFLGNEVGPPAGDATAGVFVDSYFIVLDTVNNKFQLSTLLDGTEWNGLDVAQRSFGSDPIKSMLVDHRELWFFGEKTSEVWFNSGAESFPFQPITGTFIETGTIAPWSAQRLDNSIFWLGGDERGHAVAYRAQGYTPVRISTHATEQKWLKYPTVKDAIGYSYQDQGHPFYGLYFPSSQGIDDGGTHWFYDVSTQMWHERAIWDADDMIWRPHLSRAHMFVFEKHLVGDRQSGAIYHMDLNFFDEEVILTDDA